MDKERLRNKKRSLFYLRVGKDLLLSIHGYIPLWNKLRQQENRDVNIIIHGAVPCGEV